MTEKPHHTRCPECGHHWSFKGDESEITRQHCDECGWDWGSQLLPASFRGVTFFVRVEPQETSGHKQDLGALPKE